MNGKAFAIVIAALAGAGVACADDPIVRTGAYLCTVEQKAGIGASHLENANQHEAFATAPRTRFGIMITRETTQARIVETPYAGADRDPAEWHTRNSVLHSAYLGDGTDFAAMEDSGFLRIGVANRETGALWFYHSGFEYPGGEDTNLSVRFGHCERAPHNQ